MECINETAPLTAITGELCPATEKANLCSVRVQISSETITAPGRFVYYVIRETMALDK